MRSTPLLLSLVLLVLSCSARESSTVEELLLDPVDAARDRTVPVKVYLPSAEKPLPVILFSHGLGGSRENNPYLGTHWARHGYVAVFLQHAGSDAEVWRSAAPRDRMTALKGAASARSAIQRIGDVPFVIDQLERWNEEEGHPLAGRLDLEHIGMSGHSFGASTTQAMMGQAFPGNRSAEDPRIDAFLALSPSISKRIPPETSFAGITKPVLLMTGTKDGSPIDPNQTPESRTFVYAALPAGDKFQLVFHDGEHHAFGDSRLGQRNRIPHHHPAIQLISTKFWDAYLKGDDAAKEWLRSDEVREEAALVEKDRWEWK